MPDGQKRKGEHIKDYRKRMKLADQASRLEPDQGYTAEEEKAERDRFKRAAGYGGLGGAAKMNQDKTFQSRLETHMKQWRARKRAAAAKKQGQKNAAKKMTKEQSRKMGLALGHSLAP
jgi:hypothetical protein